VKHGQAEEVRSQKSQVENERPRYFFFLFFFCAVCFFFCLFVLFFGGVCFFSLGFFFHLWDLFFLFFFLVFFFLFVFFFFCFFFLCSCFFFSSLDPGCSPIAEANLLPGTCQRATCIFRLTPFPSFHIFWIPNLSATDGRPRSCV